MRVARQLIIRAARHDEPVLVLGDTGTGKEVVARAIHQLNASRRLNPFLPVNCGAIPPDLFEAEVFGYMPGAFTNALRQGSEGIWRAAQGGTIFLDEIGDLAPAHQVKILRALDGREVRPVGSSRPVPVNARVIAATNRDLYAMTQAGDFREDLYYRLASMVINLPRLRDHPDDAARLAAHFWRDIAPRRPALPAGVLDELQLYRWQGNARELRYVLMNLHTTFPKAAPTVERLRAVLRMRAPANGRGAADDADDAVLQVECLQHLRRARAAMDACARLLRRLGRREIEADRRGHLVARVNGCLTELQLLGTRPERFCNLAAFEATHRVAGRLAALQSLLSQNPLEAARYARREIAREVAAAGASVRREEERIRKRL
jgi:transcriptional regulator with PAS, ATPase and Fis domain